MPIDILTFLTDILKTYGFNAVMFAVIIFLIWKLANNHLHHIANDVTGLGTKIDNLGEDVKASTKELNKRIDANSDEIKVIGERTSKVEGKLGL